MTGIARHTVGIEMAIHTIGWLLGPNATRAMTARVRASTWSDTRVIKLAVQEGTVHGMTGDAIARRIDVRRRHIVTTITRRRMTACGITTAGNTGVIEHPVAEFLVV